MTKEQRCREIFEQIFQKKFVRIRPDFLKYPLTGDNLEIDGYNDELKIGFEYNGDQHYHYPNIFHQTENEFTNLIQKDVYKLQTCFHLGIILIIIPYTVREPELKTFITNQLNTKNISLICL